MGGWTLTEIRQMLELTQQHVAERFGTTQSGVSRMERQHDWLVSTLVDYAASIGAVASVVLILPDGQRCELMIPAPVVDPQRDEAQTGRQGDAT